MTNKELEKLWIMFNKKATEYGYKISTHNDRNMGTGTTSFKEDSFVPMINLMVQTEVKDGQRIIVPAEMSIFVEDRNGNSILTGDWCACYRLTNENVENFEEKFTEMCDYAFKKWSVYSRNNRLDFKFNNLKEDRIIWNNK